MYELLPNENFRYTPATSWFLIILNKSKWLNHNKVLTFCRSVRENRLDAKRKKVKEKENEHKKMYTQPILQRIVYIWSAIRTDTGKSGLLWCTL